MLDDEIPDALSCSLADARGDLVKSQEIAEAFILEVIKLTGSRRKVKDYKISISEDNAIFTKYP